MWPGSGRTMISTPTKPMATAAQRWTPTTSLRISADSAVMNSGEAKDSAVDSVSGSIETAVKPQTIPTSPTAARVAWPPRRLVFSTEKPVVRET